MSRAGAAAQPLSLALLYADTGGGHRASAAAVRDALESRYGSGVEVMLVDPTVGHRSPVVRKADELYRACILRAPWLWGVAFHASDGRVAVALLRATVLRSLGRSTSTQLAQRHVDAIVSFHPLLSGAANQFAQRRADMGGLRPVTATVVTDLVAPHASWAHRGVDMVFVPNHSTARSLVERGVDAARCHRVGLPVGRQFLGVPDGSRSAIRAGLGLDDRFTVLLAGGGDGSGRLDRTARTLLRRCPDVQVCVIAGRNERLRTKLEVVAARTGGRLVVRGYVDNMAAWMRAADVVLTKAGPGSLAEAFAVGTPVVVTGHLRGQERHNPDFVTVGRAGLRSRRRRGLATIVQRLADSPRELEQLQWSARMLARPDAADEISSALIAMVGARRGSALEDGEPQDPAA